VTHVKHNSCDTQQHNSCDTRRTLMRHIKLLIAVTHVKHNSWDTQHICDKYQTLMTYIKLYYMWHTWNLQISKTHKSN